MVMMMLMWTMRDGTEIAIADMTDAHIRNAIAMLERNAEHMWAAELADAAGFVGMCNGDGAVMAAEQAFDNVARMTPQQFLEEETAYCDLLDELDRRDDAGTLFEPKVTRSLVDVWMRSRSIE